jgi:acetyl esterase/lipase
MRTGYIRLWTKDEYTYPVVGDFIPTIHWYLHEEDDADRPAVIVVPGGAYRMVSPTEGEIVALEFYNKDYNTFVVTYTTNLTDQTPLKFQPLKDLSCGITYVRSHAEIFHVKKNQIAVCGFSAGAHLAGTLAVHHDAPEVQSVGKKCEDNRPDAVILSYPVITSGKYAHRDSFVALLGKDAAEEELEYMSLEKHVTSQTPPCFLWQTADDEAVPVQNSYLMAQACMEKGVPCAHHVFSKGQHGLSLANEEWADCNIGGFYTLDQTMEQFQYLIDNDIPLPAPFDQIEIPKGTDLRAIAPATMKAYTPKQYPVPEVMVWPELAHQFLMRQFEK